ADRRHHGHADADGEHVGRDGIGLAEARLDAPEGLDEAQGDRVVMGADEAARTLVVRIGRGGEDAREEIAALPAVAGLHGGAAERLDEILEARSRDVAEKGIEPLRSLRVDGIPAAGEYLFEQLLLRAEMVVQPRLGDARP